jgi:hypothetical protein
VGNHTKRSTSTENIFQIHSLLRPRACVLKSLDDERERHIAIPCGCDCATPGWWKGRVDYVGLVNTTNHFYKIQGVVENDILIAEALVEPCRVALGLNEGKGNPQCDSWRGGWWWEVVGWWVEEYYCTYNW